MPRIRVDIITDDQTSVETVKEFLYNLRSDFALDSLATGYPAWEINEIEVNTADHIGNKDTDIHT
jgi:hypothetical protein